MRLGRKLAEGVAEDVDEVPTTEETSEPQQPVAEREPQSDETVVRAGR